MKNYFSIKASFQKVDENGKTKKVKETYLLDALSFTEGEARINKELEQIVSGDFTVTNMAQSNISEVFHNPNGDRWFKAKVKFVDIDRDSGKEKKTSRYMLVEANNVKDAYEFLEEELSSWLIPHETPAISESPIVEVFEYDVEVESVGFLNLNGEIEDVKTFKPNGEGDIREADIFKNVHADLDKNTLEAWSGKNKLSQISGQAKIGVDIVDKCPCHDENED